MIVWDTGTYRNLTERDGEEVPVEQAVEDGHVTVWLEGREAPGRLLAAPDGRRSALAAREEARRPRRRAPEPRVEPAGVRQERPDGGGDRGGGRVTGALAALSDEERALLARRPAPRSIEPMKATLTDQRFSDPDWIFEPKLDGVRCAAFRSGKSVRLVSRTGRELGQSYPELEEAIGRDDCDEFVADGEIVAFAGRRHELLPAAGSDADRGPRARAKDRHRGVPVPLRSGPSRGLRHEAASPSRTEGAAAPRTHLRGSGPLHPAPKRGRRGLLRGGLPEGVGGGDRQAGGQPLLERALVRLAQVQVLEPAGVRHRGIHRAEGQPARLRRAPDRLQPRRRAEVRRQGRHRLRRADARRSRAASARHRARRRSPYGEVVKVPGAHWVRPELVAQIGFSEWTRDGRLRHPRFLGLRDDKPPSEVVREDPAAR